MRRISDMCAYRNFSSIVNRRRREKLGRHRGIRSHGTKNGRLNYRRTVNRERNKEEDWVPGVLSSEHSRNFFFRTRVWVVRVGQRPAPKNFFSLIQPREIRYDRSLVVGFTVPTGFFLVSVVVGSPLENTCPSCRTYIRLFHPSFQMSWHFLASTRNARSWLFPRVSVIPEEYRQEKKKRGRGEGRERATRHHRVGKAG